MKSITAQHLEGVIEQIMHDREELAKIKQEQFTGVTQDEVLTELKKRLGVNWILKKEVNVKFTKDDIAAVANSRFYRKSGMKMLMAWAIIILAFAMFTMTLQFIPLYAYYGLSILVTIGFIFFYSKKQKQARIELRQAVYGSDKVEAEK